MALIVRTDRRKDLLAAIAKLTKQQVLVGIPGGSGHEDKSDGSAGIDNANLGYILETGSPAKNIPARPFLVPGVRSAKANITALAKKGAVAVFHGDGNAAERTLHAIGTVAVTAVRQRMEENVPPPLAASTLAARRRRGRTSEKTLIDKGELRNAITYVIRDTKRDGK